MHREVGLRANQNGSEAGTVTTATPRRIQTTERLLDAALSVFAERGVGAATVEQVCERAGFTRGAFYSNFESWDELYLGILRREYLRVGDTGNRLMADLQAEVYCRHEGDLVTPTVQAFVQAAGHDAAHVMALIDLRQYAARNPVLWPGLLEVSEQMRRVLRELVEALLPAVGLRLRVDPDIAITALIALYESVGVGCVISGEDLEQTVTKALVDLLEGLLAPLG